MDRLIDLNCQKRVNKCNFFLKRKPNFFSKMLLAFFFQYTCAIFSFQKNAVVLFVWESFLAEEIQLYEHEKGAFKSYSPQHSMPFVSRTTSKIFATKVIIDDDFLLVEDFPIKLVGFALFELEKWWISFAKICNPDPFFFNLKSKFLEVIYRFTTVVLLIKQGSLNKRIIGYVIFVR